MGYIVQLSFSDSKIRAKGDMICLTDMWKADGSVYDKRPAKWREHYGTIEFVSYIADVEKVLEKDIFYTQRGRTGGTWAHWQIAMAYAKYLSPEFHAWCNTVVRAHMDGRATPSTGIQHLAPEAREVLRIAA